MAYIDLEKSVGIGYLCDWYQNSIMDNVPPVWTDEHLEELLKDFIVIPKDTPTADVVEVKHGEWISYETEETYGDDGNIWYKCSVCGTDALGRCYEDEWYSYPIKSDYCSSCGAKMDGERRYT